MRSDGKVLNTNNYWTSLHYEPVSNFKDTYLNIFDFVSLGNYTYTVTYTNPPPNTNAPVTTLILPGLPLSPTALIMSPRPRKCTSIAGRRSP